MLKLWTNRLDVNHAKLSLLNSLLVTLFSDGIFKLIKSLIAVKPPDLRLTTSINYEARALAFIIFALKYLLGLDGLTEKKISEIAMMVNRFVNCIVIFQFP